MMPGGISIGRSWVVVLRDGTFAIDWGDGVFQDAISGDFFKGSESRISHRAQVSDLEWLCKIGRVQDYNEQNVIFVSLPERINRTIE